MSSIRPFPHEDDETPEPARPRDPLKYLPCRCGSNDYVIRPSGQIFCKTCGFITTPLTPPLQLP
jgi:hypothetical protein